MKNLIEEQNRRLIAYAENKIVEIGDKIKSYNSKHNMDRTGNLLNSLCWGVSYQGKLIGSGFYRDATTRGAWIGDGYYSTSFLHEFFGSQVFTMYPVNGRQLAEEYIQRNGNTGSRGWKVFFAILAPYWGYWEKGFTLTSFGKERRRRQFAVMAQVYDQVRRDLKPAKKYYFNVSVPKYDKPKMLKKAEM